MWKAGSSANQIAFYPRRKNRMACAQMLSGAIVAVSVAQPVPTDLEQLRNVIAQRTFKVPQRRGRSHPKVLR